MWRRRWRQGLPSVIDCLSCQQINFWLRCYRLPFHPWTDLFKEGSQPTSLLSQRRMGHLSGRPSGGPSGMSMAVHPCLHFRCVVLRCSPGSAKAGVRGWFSVSQLGTGWVYTQKSTSLLEIHQGLVLWPCDWNTWNQWNVHSKVTSVHNNGNPPPYFFIVFLREHQNFAIELSTESIRFTVFFYTYVL